MERDQPRPADWAKKYPAQHFKETDIPTPKSEWKWRKVATLQDFNPDDPNQTSVAVKYGESQLAVFRVPRRGFFASQQMCPHSTVSTLCLIEVGSLMTERAFVLDHGLVGDDGKGGTPYVSCQSFGSAP